MVIALNNHNKNKTGNTNVDIKFSAHGAFLE